MFDIGASELLMIAIVAIVVIGPKEMPRALRAAGRWIGQMRKMSNHFRAGIDEMIRQAEIEDMEAQWAERNKQIMAKYPTGDAAAGGAADDLAPPMMRPLDGADADARAQAAIARASPNKASAPDGEPSLPLDPPVPPKEA